MLVNASEMLKKAKAGHYAVGQFNINNLEWKSNPAYSTGTQLSGYPWCIRRCRKIHDRLQNSCWYG